MAMLVLLLRVYELFTSWLEQNMMSCIFAVGHGFCLLLLRSGCRETGKNPRAHPEQV